MAKAATKTKTPPPTANKKTGTAVSKIKEGAVGAADDLLKMMEQDAGKGVSTRAEDNVVPLLYVLQSNSPQLDRSDAQYIKGAKAGDYWVRGTQVVIDGEEEGLDFVPCFHWHGWVQWGADRGGFKGRHDERPKSAREIDHPTKEGRKVWVMPDATGKYNAKCDTLSETIQYAGIITSLDAPISLVVPFKSTGLTPAKLWMGLINAKVMSNGKTFPIYSHVYRLKTVAKKNDDGSWYQPIITDAGGDDEGAEAMMISDMALYKAAKKIHDDFSSGALRADADVSEETSNEEDDSDM